MLFTGHARGLHATPRPPGGRKRPVFVLAATRRRRHDGAMSKPRRVVIVIFPGVQPIDAIGPAEVFRTASRLDPPGYTVELVAADPGPVRSSTVGLEVDRTFSACRGPIDTLLVAGGTGVVAAQQDERVVSWLRAAAKRSQRVCSVCTGAFLLAAAGLLEGRRATTHWSGCALLAREYPSVTVEPDQIYVRDGGLY